MSKPRRCPRCKKEWAYSPGYSINSQICWTCMTPEEQEEGEKKRSSAGRIKWNDNEV